MQITLRAVDIEGLGQGQGRVSIHVEAFREIINQKVSSIGAKSRAANTGFELLAPIIGARNDCL